MIFLPFHFSIVDKMLSDVLQSSPMYIGGWTFERSLGAPGCSLVSFPMPCADMQEARKGKKKPVVIVGGGAKLLPL